MAMSVYSARRKKLLEKAGKGSVAVATPANLFWLTGFWGGGVGAVKDDRTVVITSLLEAGRAAEQGNEVEVVTVKMMQELVPALSRALGKGKATVDDDSLMRGDPSFKRDPNIFLGARRVKDEEELRRIARASAGLDKIFRALETEVKPGRTEWQVASEVMRLATELGMTPTGSDTALSPTIIASGENGALPHSELTGRRLKEGDFVVADIFFRSDGYHSDSTRTFAVGGATAEMKRHYEAVREAQEAALGQALEGEECESVHEEAVKVLKRRGMEKLLNHSVGHGVGIDIHELPRVSRGNKEKLLRNDVITDEPGVYLPGKFGVRIEDTLVIGRTPKVLTRYTKELVTCG